MSYCALSLFLHAHLPHTSRTRLAIVLSAALSNLYTLTSLRIGHMGAGRRRTSVTSRSPATQPKDAHETGWRRPLVAHTPPPWESAPPSGSQRTASRPRVAAARLPPAAYRGAWSLWAWGSVYSMGSAIMRRASCEACSLRSTLGSSTPGRRYTCRTWSRSCSCVRR